MSETHEYPPSQDHTKGQQPPNGNGKPDPSALTTAQLIREIGGLREVIETRLDGMDKAIQLLQSTTDKLPERIDEKIGSLKEVHEEKFRSIQVQFIERDARTEQTSRDSKVAVDAALQAAKEAVGEQNRSSALAIAKSETATVKQIDQQGLLISTATTALDDKINDIKDRLTRIEGKEVGLANANSGQQASSNFTVSLIGMIFGVLIGVGGIIFAIVRQQH